MALFDDVSSLEDALGRQADTQANTLQNVYAKKRRQSVAQQAKLGRLGSGVSNYQFGDLAAEELGDLGEVQSGLAEALSSIPADDYATEQDNRRKFELAKLIGELSQSGGGALGGALGGLSGALGGAAQGFSVGGPWGAVAGGALGGSLGAYGGSQKRRSF